MSEADIEKKVADIAKRVCADYDLELVHVEIVGAKKTAVRIFIDKPEGVTHQDCLNVSRQVETTLDVEDFIHSAYTLEVSSPGLDRELYKLADYERFSGSPAKMKTRELINSQRNFRGHIIGIEGENVIFEDKTSGRVVVLFENIVKANLEVDIDEEFRRARERDEKAANQKN